MRFAWALLACLCGVACADPDVDEPDTGARDAGVTADAATLDMGTPDTGTPDTGTPDTGTPDMGQADAEPPDLGMDDAGPADTGVADAGSPDSGSVRRAPIAYYSFDTADVTGSVAHDVSGTGVAYDLDTAAGAPSFTQTGTIGNAGFFNGASALQGGFTATPTVTVSLWIRETAAPGSGAVMIVTYSAFNVPWQSWEIRATNSGYTFFNAAGGSSQVAEAFDATGTGLNTWIHIVGVYDGAEARIYRDGLMIDSGVATFPFGNIPSSASHDLNVGYSGYNNSLYYTGYIDELAIFAGALSDSEILELYDEGRSGQRVVP